MEQGVGEKGGDVGLVEFLSLSAIDGSSILILTYFIF